MSRSTFEVLRNLHHIDPSRAEESLEPVKEGEQVIGSLPTELRQLFVAAHDAIGEFVYARRKEANKKTSESRYEMALTYERMMALKQILQAELLASFPDVRSPVLEIKRGCVLVAKECLPSEEAPSEMEIVGIAIPVAFGSAPSDDSQPLRSRVSSSN